MGCQSSRARVQKKDCTKVGYIARFKSRDCVEIGYMLVKEERGRGYGGEAVQMMVDYLFLHKNIVRIQAETHPSNKASQMVLEKAGFTLEGRIRKSFLSRGVYRNTAMHSILREEWKERRSSQSAMRGSDIFKERPSDFLSR